MKLPGVGVQEAWCQMFLGVPEFFRYSIQKYFQFNFAMFQVVF